MALHDKNPINLLYVSEAFHFGGGEVSLTTLIRHLDRRRYNPIVLCYRNGKLAGTLSVCGIETHVLERGAILTDPILVSSIMALIRNRHIHLVHVNSLDIRAGIAAELSGVPFIGHLRVIFPFTWIDRLFVRLSARVVAVSDAVRDIFCEGHGSLRSKFITIPNALSLKGRPRKTDIRSELGLSPSTRLIAAASRIDPCKGLHTFIQAAAELKRRTANVKFLLLGSADPGDPGSTAYERELHHLVEKLALTGDFYFLGFRNDALGIIAQSDVLAVPSLVLKTKAGLKTEGFGRVIIEAMALGTPVVATRVGGIPEVIVDGESGLLVPPESPGQMATAIVSVLEDDALRQKIVRGGKRRFQEKYHIDRHIAQIQNLYGEILQRHG